MSADIEPSDAAQSPLLLLRLRPDLQTLARWAAATGQRALREDPGYALHAALRATLGRLAPKPFVLLRRPGSVQLIGYSRAGAADVQRAVEMAAATDLVAAQAVGIARASEAVIRPMPHDWRGGESLSFEVRVAPVVRSRNRPGGGYPEIDAAFHPDFASDETGDRDAAYRHWLGRELGRGGAASLLWHRALSFQLTPMARRGRVASDADSTARRTRGGLLPDLSVRGELRVDDSESFNALLARGLGRHRSFGFGCLLVAPPGAWA